MNSGLKTEIQVKTLANWQGQFGQEYIKRNLATAEATTEAEAVFRRILQNSGISTEVESILEVGANIGINLTGLRRAFGSAIRLAALEPNTSAVEQLRSNTFLDLEQVIEGSAYNLPLPDNTYDLVFTNGVLIHVPPDELPVAMREIARVSRKYVLCSEYFSHVPVEVTYHSESGLLWKRDFGRDYLQHCSNLRVRDYGFIWQAEFPHFDDLNWWIFEKVQ